MDTSDGGRPLVDGRFELISPLGSGGMGTVWRARDIALHREVALKEVRPPDEALAAARPDLAVQLRERALREARALARLAHPHVVTIHHIVEPADGGHPWLVMELVTGGSLHDRLARGPMPVADTVRVGLEVLAALRAAHAEGVLHRDVKPANVLLRPDGAAVLTDFGIAALHEAPGLTKTGDLIGSPEYIAPERVRGEEGNPASDLWSLGMMLYVAAEGTHPLRRATSLATVVAVLDEPIPAPVRSGALAPVLERLLVRDPAARPDGAALDRMLREITAAPGGATPHAAPPRPAPGTSAPAGGYGHPGPATAGPPAGYGYPHPASGAPSGSGYGYPAGPHPAGAGFGPPPAHAHPGPGVTVPAHPAPVDRSARRGRVLAAAVLTAVLAGGGYGIVQLLPDGKDSASTSGSAGGPQASTRSSAPAGSAGRPSTGTTARPAGSDPSKAAETPEAPTGSMLTPAAIRAAVAAFKAETGTTVFVDMNVYETYILADVPAKPGSKLYKSYRYDGAVSAFGAGGRVDPEDQLIDMAAVDWDVLPGLLDRSVRELGVSGTVTRYVLVEPWLMDGTPSMRPYMTDEEGNGGYVYADLKGNVKKIYRD
ncbi:protein kinase [Streptomyces sp. NPDC097619]|uniref:serine/threonine-protein kinase n=1 Tax=Streptomyces sp. NPDC097619 TaxID=3157228 RepID=UPI003327AFA2